MANQQPELYASAHFALELEGVKTATVKSVDGGHPKAEVITYHSNHQKGAQYKQSGKRKYEDLKVVFAMSAQPDLWAWLNSFLIGDCPRKHGAVVAADYEYKEKARRTFKDAVIAGIEFPKFDAKDKNAATLTLTLSPEEICYDAPKAAEVGSATTRDATEAAQQHIKACNFEFTMDGIPADATSRVTKVDGFSVKCKIIEHHYSAAAAPLKIAGKIEMPTVSFYLPEIDAEPFRVLMKNIMTGTQNDQRNAELKFYDNKHTQQGSFTFKDCTVTSVAAEKHDSGNEEVRQVKVEMQVENLVFTAGGK